jgi:hypothetical protein
VLESKKKIGFCELLLIFCSYSSCCKLIYLIWFPIFIATLFFGKAYGADSNTIAYGTLEWEEVALEDRGRVLEFLVNQTRSNYEKIKTWKGAYDVSTKEYLSEEYVANAFGDRLSEEEWNPLIQAINIHLNFVIDVQNDKAFRQLKSEELAFFKIGSKDKVSVKGAGKSDFNSSVTSEHFLKFDPNEVATYSAYPDHPDAQDKRVARRFPNERAVGQHHSDLVDPRLFFSESGMADSKFWDLLGPCLLAINGEGGTEAKKWADGIRVDESNVSGSTWYRIRIPFDANVRTMTTIWSPEAGYNPVALTSISSGHVEKQIKWKWKKDDEIYVPSDVTEFWQPIDSEVPTFKRHAELTENTLNQPIQSNQFDYVGLGMKDGDLVLDEIEQVVYVLRDDELEKLARYGEKYTPLSKATSSSRSAFITLNVLIISALAALWILKSRQKR